jgi:hypothetical protein
MFENSLVKTVSKISLWLAPLPSAYFVSRASVTHLVTFPFQYLIAVVIELLGISTMHSALWLYGWRQESLTEKGNLRTGYAAVTSLEIILSVIFGAIYLVTTISIIVVLEVAPAWSTVAPALFPLMSVVGAANLALIARQESRERLLAEHKESKQKPLHTLYSEDNKRGALKEARKEVLLTLLQSNPEMNPTEAAKAIGVSRPTVYSYLKELKESGSIEK